MSASHCTECVPTPPGTGWLAWFVDSGPFVARWHCGDFGQLGWAWIAVSGAIAVVYFVIAYSCMRAARLLRGDPALPRPWKLRAIAAFFVGCAGSHFWNALAFAWPAYRLAVLWDLLTFLASIIGVMAVTLLYRRFRDYVLKLQAERSQLRTEIVGIMDSETPAETIRAARHRLETLLESRG